MACAATPLALSGCVERLSIVHPAGPAARVTADLWWIMLIGSGAITVFMLGLVTVAVLRGRAADSDAAPDPAADRRASRLWFGVLGLAFPLVTLAALTGYGLFIGERLLPRAGSDVVTVQAEARQWAWSFRYADAPGLVTEGVLHIPANRPVDVQITSVDVIHAFWVPRLAGKLDAIPGHVNVLRIETDGPGTFAGQSAEFSGYGYREHVFTVQAHDPEAWARLLREGTP